MLTRERMLNILSPPKQISDRLINTIDACDAWQNGGRYRSDEWRVDEDGVIQFKHRFGRGFVKVGYRDQLGRLVHVRGTVNPGDKKGLKRKALFEAVSDYLVELCRPESDEPAGLVMEW